MRPLSLDNLWAATDAVRPVVGWKGTYMEMLLEMVSGAQMDSLINLFLLMTHH